MPIFGLHGNISNCSGKISRFGHDFYVASPIGSYLTDPEAHSCAAGYFFLGSIPSRCVLKGIFGPIHVNCNILKFVAASAAEAETGGCFVTGIYVISLRNTLEEMGQPQTIAQLFMDNMAAAGITNNTIKKQQSCAMNMRYFWIRNQKYLRTYSLHGNQDKKIL